MASAKLSDITARDITVTQDFSTTVLPSPEVEFPVFFVPLADQGERFMVREGLLAELSDRIGKEAVGVALTQTLAGTGGVGKSQLAAQVAYRNRHRLDVVWWVSCAAPDHDRLSGDSEPLTPAALARAGLAALSTRLGLPEGEDPAFRVREWLEHTDRPWLVVFDDVADPAVLAGLVPQRGPGLVLVTSRNRHWDCRVLDVEVFDADSAARFLQARSGLADPDGARALAEALGGLALALDQAGAFLAQVRPAGIGFAAYLAEIEQRGLAVFADQPATDYDRVVTTVWDRSLKEVAARSSTAIELLDVLGVLAPAPLPLSVLRDGGGQGEGWRPFELAEALRTLGAYSLLDTGGQDLVVHRLVHRRIGERTASAPRCRARARAVALLLAAFPSDARLPETWPAATTLLAHVSALVKHGLDDPAGASLAARAGAALRWQGDLAGAKAFEEEVIAACRELLGPHHPDTLAAASNLAETLRALGDLTGAQTLQEEVLDASRELLGTRHPDTLTAASNLAATLWALGDLAGAQMLQEEVLATRSELLGTRHPDTLTAASNLAETLRAQGDLSPAQTLQEEVLTASTALFGFRHPDTLNAANNLVGTLWDQGDLTGSRDLGKEVLAARQEVLGRRHPATLVSANNLAEALRALGDLVGARVLHEKVLAARREVLGRRHPDTLVSANNLALTLRAQGEPVGARVLLEEVLAARRELLGLRHPDTSVSAWNLYATVQAVDAAAARRVLEEHLRWLVAVAPDALRADQAQIRRYVTDEVGW